MRKLGWIAALLLTTPVLLLVVASTLGLGGAGVPVVLVLAFVSWIAAAALFLIRKQWLGRVGVVHVNEQELTFRIGRDDAAAMFAGENGVAVSKKAFFFKAR